MSKISPVGYLVVKTMEECGEAIQAAGKILLHGPDAEWKKDRTNMQVLSEELADVAVHIAVLLDLDILDRKLWNQKYNEREQIVLNKMKEMAEKEEADNNGSDGRASDSK